MLQLDVRTYTKAWAGQITADLAKEMAQASVAAPGPFLSWKDKVGADFIRAAMRPVTTAGVDELWNVLTSTLSPASPEAAINRGRDADEAGNSPMEYKPAVATELRVLYTQQLNESLARIVPRYLEAKDRALLREYAQEHSSRAAGPGSPPTGNGISIPPALVLQPLSVPHEPSPDDIAPSHPMDRPVIAALVNGIATVDITGYRGGPAPAAPSRPPRSVDFEVEVNTGSLAWVRVSSADATAEDVAKTMYGDAALAYTITAATPLFGIDPQRVRADLWPKVRAAPRTGFAVGDTTGVPPTDAPLAVPQHDEAALNQAAKLPMRSSSADEVVQRMRLSLLGLDELAVIAQTFGLEKNLVPLRAKIDARSKSVHDNPDPDQAMQWDAQSAEQLELIGKATAGVRMAAKQYAAMRSPSGPGKPDTVPSYVDVPLRGIAQAYVDAAVESDLVVTGRAKLNAADQKSTTYPVDVLDGLFANLRSVLIAAKTDKRTGTGLSGDEALGVSPVLEREEKLRNWLPQIRESLVSSPDRAAEEISLVQEELDDLQTDVTFIGMLDSLDTLIGETYSHFTQGGAYGGKNDPDAPYKKISSFLRDVRGRVDDLRRSYQRGYREEAKQGLKMMLVDADFNAILTTVAGLIQDQARRDAIESMIIKIGAMVGIAVVTMGIGTLVEGGLIGLGWTAAGFGTVGALGTTAVVTASEALSFTVLSRQILESDPEHSFIVDFLTNWGLSTVLRGVGAGYEAFVGAEAAATVAGKGVGLLVQFESATATALGIEYARRKAAGKDLTRADARDIVLQSAAVFIGAAIAARVAKPMLEGLKLGGRTFGLRIREINRQRIEVRDLALALKKSKTITQAPDVLAKDAAVLPQEQKLIDDMIAAAKDPAAPADAKRSSSELAELAALRQNNAAAIEGNARTRITLKLEPVGNDTFLARKGDLTRSGGIADEFRALGDKVEPGPKDPVTDSESVIVTPKSGPERLRVVEKAGDAEPVATGKKGAKAKGGSCFVAGTSVFAPSGPRSIEQLAVGDAVLAAAPADSRRAAARVFRTTARDVSAVLDIRIDRTTVTCTPEHPFWVSGVGWRTAGSLEVGMPLLSLGGQAQVISEIVTRAGDFTVYNLEVEGLQTYFVSDLGILVHNKAWELLPPLRPALGRVEPLRQQIERMTVRPGDDPRPVMRERLARIRERLAEIDQRQNRAGSFDDIRRLRVDLVRAEHDMAVLDRITTEPVPLPTPREQAMLDEYVRQLNRWQEARAAGPPRQAEADQANAAMEAIEELAVTNHGEDNPLSRLFDHLESISDIRLGRTSSPVPVAPGSTELVEGYGRRFTAASTRPRSFRGMSFSEVEAAIGRPPNFVNGRYPDRVRIIWQFPEDGSSIHVDVPKSDNANKYQINRDPHVARQAGDPNPEMHLTDDGIGIPTGSTAAHTTIGVDSRLTHLTVYGLK